MKPKLILLNGNPGMGKTTIAERYVDEHPLTLNLDVDRVWHMMGQWQSELEESMRLKYEHSYALAGSHLSQGYDVIVPDLIETVEQVEKYERIANLHDATFCEVVLICNQDDAIERCKARARSLGYEDGFRPGGLLNMQGRERKLVEMHQNVLQVTAARDNTVQITPILGDIDYTYHEFLLAIE